MTENNTDIMEIKIKKVIPAKKWKIVRTLTRVAEFPSFVPTVKETKVLEKNKNVIKTFWYIQVDSIPIKWVEEERILFDKGIISFRAIDGDIQEFYGEWRFNNHPNGTEVELDLKLKVDIPAIKEFTQDYIKNIITKNFETLLDAIEERIVSLEYLEVKKEKKSSKIAGFGLIGHPYNFFHLERCLKMLNPEFKMPSLEFLEKLFELTPSFKLYDIENFQSKANETTRGCFIVATIIPEIIQRDIWTAFSKIIKACKLAEKYQVGIIALGGFTSIIGEKVGKIHEIIDVPITTGNTFTSALVVDGVLKAAELLDLDLKKSTLTIVGGSGDIGSGCARVLVDKVKKLILTGRTKENLKKIRDELKKRCKKTKIDISLNNQKAVKDADIVISAASSVSSILKPEWFKKGAIVCDVGYPKNISYSSAIRNDIFVFSGGLAKPPTPISLPIDLGLPSNYTLYGCFSEAIILALEKRYENFSFGRGNIIPEKIEEIKSLAKKHGFEVADFYCGDKLIDKERIEEIKRARTK